MQKKSLMSIILLSLILLPLQLVSAYTGDGFIGEIFEMIGWENLLLIGTFFISLIILKFSLTRTPLGKSTGSFLAIIISFMITGGIYFTGFNLGDFFDSMGLYDDVLSILIPAIIIIGIIWARSKYGFGKILMAIALIFGAIAFTDLVEEPGTLIGIAIGLLLLGWFLNSRRNKKEREGEYGTTSGGGFKWPKRRSPQDRLDRYNAKQELKKAKSAAWEETGRKWGYFKAQSEDYLNKRKIGKAHKQAIEEDKRRTAENERRNRIQSKWDARKKKIKILPNKKRKLTN